MALGCFLQSWRGGALFRRALLLKEFWFGLGLVWSWFGLVWVWFGLGLIWSGFGWVWVVLVWSGEFWFRLGRSTCGAGASASCRSP